MSDPTGRKRRESLGATRGSLIRTDVAREQYSGLPPRRYVRKAPSASVGLDKPQAISRGTRSPSLKGSTIRLKRAVSDPTTPQVENNRMYKMAQDYKAMSAQLKNMNIVNKQFSKTEAIRESFLGGGAFGSTYRCLHKLDGGKRAVKVIPYTSVHHRTKLLREAQALQSLAHHNIVRYFNVDIHEDSSRVLVVMECCNGTLLQLLPSLSLKMARGYTSQIAEALTYLHCQRGIIHRDLKLDNVFISFDEEVCRLGDFGLARSVRESRERDRDNNVSDAAEMKRATSAMGGLSSEEVRSLESQRGHVLYRSPEDLERGRIVSYPDDCWSFGLLISELVTRKTVIERVRESRTQRIPVAMLPDILERITMEVHYADPNVLGVLVDELLKRDCKSRYTAPQVLEYLGSPEDMPRASINFLRSNYDESRIEAFLDVDNLADYAPIFIQKGVKFMYDLLHCSEDEIDEILKAGNMKKVPILKFTNSWRRNMAKRENIVPALRKELLSASNACKELDIWLKAAGLEEYADALKNELGVSSVSDMKYVRFSLPQAKVSSREASSFLLPVLSTNPHRLQ